MSSRAALTLTLVALLTLAACGDGGESTSAPPAGPSDAATEAPIPTEAPSATAAPTPTPTPEPTPTEEPTEEPSDEATPEASDAAAACTGTDENREFFASIAAAVDWPVVCLAEDGWFVTTGSYSLREGGRLQIGYRGPDGATLDLREGTICDGEGCAPAGTVIRDAELGELGNAQLIDLGGGSFAVVADPDANPSWILVSTGLTGDELADIAAGFATVGG